MVAKEIAKSLGAEFDIAKNEADYIAISFDYSYYKYTGYGTDKLQLWCSGRQRFIQDLIDKGYWDWSKLGYLEKVLLL